MSESNLLNFLGVVAARADLLEGLKVRSKAEVIEVAAEVGLPFTEAEFDAVIWDLEMKLAAKRREKFDNHFPLWHTMWGQYYLEYLVLDMFPSLVATGLYPPGKEPVVSGH